MSPEYGRLERQVDALSRYTNFTLGHVCLALSFAVVCLGGLHGAGGSAQVS